MADLKNIKLSSLKLPVSSLTKNLGWVFFGVFVLLAVLEAFEINSSVQIILESGQEPPLITAEKGVRINFENYNDIVTRINKAPDFEPTGGITNNPFQ